MVSVAKMTTLIKRNASDKIIMAFLIYLEAVYRKELSGLLLNLLCVLPLPILSNNQLLILYKLNYIGCLLVERKESKFGFLKAISVICLVYCSSL